MGGTGSSSGGSTEMQSEDREAEKGMLGMGGDSTFIHSPCTKGPRVVLHRFTSCLPV